MKESNLDLPPGAVGDNLRRFVIALVLCGGVLLTQSSPAKVVGFVNNDGFIVIRGDGEEALGLDIRSAGSHLFPLDPEVADPWQAVLSNTPARVTLGSLGVGNAVELSGDLVTAIGYDQREDPTIDLAASQWGDGLETVELPFVPEPTSAWLAACGAIGLLGCRRRRHKKLTAPFECAG